MIAWIKTEADLPSIRQTVLISIDGRVSPAWFDGCEFREIGGGMYPNFYRRPSHWMPLPDAPAAETGTPPASRSRVVNRWLAIDPGTTESGWCVYTPGHVLASGVCSNEEMLSKISFDAKHLAPEHCFLTIEMIASYGMAVGREVFETCVWIGRFQQAWHTPEAVKLVYRKDVKLHLCGSPRAKDANIRVALIDLIGPQGTKKQPGPTYGVKSHAWAALGVAVTAAHELTTYTE